LARSKTTLQTTPGRHLSENPWLLWLILLSNLVLVGILVTRVLAHLTKQGEEVKTLKTRCADLGAEVEVLKALRDEDKIQIERLQDFKNRISERRD